MLPASSVLAHIGTVSKAVPAAMLQVYRRHMTGKRVGRAAKRVLDVIRVDGFQAVGAPTVS